MKALDCKKHPSRPEPEVMKADLKLVELQNPLSNGFTFVKLDSVSFESELDQLVYISIAMRFGRMSAEEFEREICRPTSICVDDLISTLDLPQQLDIEFIKYELPSTFEKLMSKSVSLCSCETPSGYGSSMICNLLHSVHYDGSVVSVAPTRDLKEFYQKTAEIF